MKDMKSGRNYMIINIDEPYAEEIYNVLKKGQVEKGQWPEGDISFDDWKVKTFGPFNVDDHPEAGIVNIKCNRCNQYLKADGFTTSKDRDREIDHHRKGDCKRGKIGE